MGRDVYEAGHSMMSEISSRKSPGTQAAPLPAVSVVIPVLNEAGNILPLVNEIIEALSTLEDFEIIYVDDGSTDETPNLLADLTKTVSELHFIRHQKRAGQSAAIRTGVGAASFPLIATLDGDGQNVPANIPDLIRIYLRARERNSGKFALYLSFKCKLRLRSCSLSCCFIKNNNIFIIFIH